MTTSKAEINSYITGRLSAMERQVCRTLSYLGEIVTSNARSLGSYKDQTGNLRSSIGYVVVCDGRIVGGYSGNSEGESFANKIAAGYRTGIVLIVVAGMNYAAYVSGKGYNVLESAELLANREAPRLLGELGFKD